MDSTTIQIMKTDEAAFIPTYDINFTKKRGA